MRIGSLRWPVIVARRRQNFDGPEGISIFEDWVQVEIVHAEIIPISALTFYGAVQVDMPVTHRITTRWLNYLDQTDIIARTTVLPNGELRGELYRIRRIKELNGRKRFTSLDAELERVSHGPLTGPTQGPSMGVELPADTLAGPDGAVLVGEDGEILVGFEP